MSVGRSWFMQESPALNRNCFGEIRLLSKKYFNMLSYDKLKNLATDGKKRDWTSAFYVLFVAFLKNS